MARPIEKRTHIEKAVVEVVANKGLNATTIQDLALAAKVSPGLLYRYWENRDHLAGEVYREHLATLLQRLADKANGTPGVWPRLRIMVRELLVYADEEPTILKFLLFTQYELGDAVPEQQGVRHFAHELVTAGLKEGVFRPINADVAMQLTIGIVIQPIVGAMYGHLSRPVAQHADEILAALERALSRRQPEENLADAQSIAAQA